MLSYHQTLEHAWQSHDGWENAETLDFERIARCVVKFPWSPAVWQGRRITENFKSCHLMVLDFDDGEMTVKDAINAFCDCRHIIATTKSHQKPKGDSPPVDRFRVVMQFATPITSVEVYRATMAAIRRKYPVDRSVAINPVAWYWPCVELHSVCPTGEDWAPVKPVLESPETLAARAHYRRAKFEQQGYLPEHVQAFLVYGHLFKGCGRNQTIFTVAAHLGAVGMPFDAALEMIKKAPLAWGGFTDRELLNTVRNGHKKGAAHV
jgi:hypothetical protein